MNLRRGLPIISLADSIAGIGTYDFSRPEFTVLMFEVSGARGRRDGPFSLDFDFLLRVNKLEWR